MLHQVYGYPRLSRYGLGNLLFPWARCFLWCRENNLPMIAPRWTQIRIGPYLRRERDKRNYQRLFEHHGYISGIRRAALLTSTPKIDEEHKDSALETTARKRQIVVFSEMATMFDPLRGHSQALRVEINRITRSQFIPQSRKDTPYIGIHVRRGDFAAPKTEADLREGHTSLRIPLTWYIAALTKLRDSIEGWAPALVFSDGTEKELADLLALPDVTLQRGNAAITDLLALANSRAIVASGSTFSMWASFLSQAPTIWFPGQRKQLVSEMAHDGAPEPEFDLDRGLSPTFIEVLRVRWCM